MKTLAQSLGQAIRKLVQAKQGRLAPNSVRNYHNAAKAFDRTLGSKSVGRITNQDFDIHVAKRKATICSSPTASSTTLTATACPSAMGGNARHTPRALPCCIPSATANNYPIPGLIPWYAPRNNIAFHSISGLLDLEEFLTEPRLGGSGVAIGVRRSVAAFQPHLVRTHAVRLDKELRVELHPLAIYTDLGHPPAHAVGIKLGVPRRVQAIGEVNALAITADFDHLWATIERLFRFAWMCCAADDAAEPDGTDFFRVEWVADVILNKLPRTPATDVKVVVVYREIDVGHQRRNGFETLQNWW